MPDPILAALDAADRLLTEYAKEWHIVAHCNGKRIWVSRETFDKFTADSYAEDLNTFGLPGYRYSARHEVELYMTELPY